MEYGVQEWAYEESCNALRARARVIGLLAVGVIGHVVMDKILLSMPYTFNTSWQGHVGWVFRELIVGSI